MQDTARYSRLLRLAPLLLAGGIGWPGTALADDNCRLYLSPGQADYGRLHRAAILEARQPSGGYSLGKRQLTLNVTCTRPAALTLFVGGAATGDGNYSFGPRGRLALTLSQARVDGRALTLGSVEQATQLPAQTGASLPLLPGKGVALMAGSQPGMGQQYAMQLDVEASLPAEALSVSAETEVGSSHSIEVIQR